MPFEEGLVALNSCSPFLPLRAVMATTTVTPGCSTGTATMGGATVIGTSGFGKSRNWWRLNPELKKFEIRRSIRSSRYLLEKPKRRERRIMPKRAGHLFEKYVKFSNFNLALHEAATNKKRRKSVQRCFSNISGAYDGLLKIKKCTGEYVEKVVVDPSSEKVRRVLIPKFYPYQIIHHMIVNVCYPILFRGAYQFSCGSIVDKGGLYASEYIRRALVKDPKNTRYFVKLDVRHFYDSVDHKILKDSFRRVIKDEKFLSLMDSVVDSVPGEKGLPIGNYTSQIFANYYLQRFDHFVKEDLKIPYYIRYMDDMVLIGPNKRVLEKDVVSIKKYLLDNLLLSTHGNEQVVPVSYNDSNGHNHGQFIDLCGYRHYRGHTTIRRRDFKRVRRCVIRVVRWLNSQSHIPIEMLRRLFSYWGMLVHTDSEKFRNENLNDGQISFLKSLISKGAKQYA